MFVIKSDFNKQIRPSELQALTLGNDNALEEAIASSVSLATSYLSPIYHTAKIFVQVWEEDEALAAQLGDYAAILVPSSTATAFWRLVNAVPSTPVAAPDWVLGDRRNPILKTNIVEIAICTLYSAMSDRQIPAHRLDAQERIIKWYEQLRDGKLEMPDLPKRLKEDGSLEGTLIKFDSRPRFDFDF